MAGKALTRYEVEADVQVVFLDELGRPRAVGLAGAVGGRIGVRWLEKTYQGRGLPMADKEMQNSGVLAWEERDYEAPSPEELWQE